MTTTTTTNESTEYSPHQVALALYLECEPGDLSEERWDCYGMPVFSHESGEYAVGTDAEADSAWDAELDNYIEDCIQPEIDKVELGGLSGYLKFDEAAWKSDARMDGRGHALNRYDGGEEEQEVDGVTYYIFRQN